MKLHLFRKEEQAVNVWSGGQTTQLAIYPFDSKLSERNFLFRISTASIEVEASDFSLFTGYRRTLMLLEGKLELNHKGKHTKTLVPFEYDEFEGSWETTSKGKGKDYNVIYSDKINSVTVLHKELDANQLFEIEKDDFIGIWCLSGNIEANGIILNEKDFLLTEHVNHTMPIKATTRSQLIIARLMYK